MKNIFSEMTWLTERSGGYPNMSSISFLVIFRFFFLGWVISRPPFISWETFLSKMTVAITFLATRRGSTSVLYLWVLVTSWIQASERSLHRVSLTQQLQVCWCQCCQQILDQEELLGQQHPLGESSAKTSEVNSTRTKHGAIAIWLHTLWITRNSEIHKADSSQMSFSSKEIVFSREDIATKVRRRLRKAPDWSERLKELEGIQKPSYRRKIWGPTYKPSNTLLTSIEEWWSSRQNFTDDILYPFH